MVDTKKTNKSKVQRDCIKAFHGPYNCAEAVLGAGQDVLGRKDKIPTSLAQPFGGGVAGRGHICGAISAGLMTMGLAEKSRQEIDQLSRAFLEDCQKDLGSLMCRDIAQPGPEGYGQGCDPALVYVCQWLEEKLG